MISISVGTASVAESRFGRVIRVVAGNAALIRLLLAYLAMVVAEFGEWLAVIVYAYVRGGASAAGLVVILQLIPSMLLAPLISAQLARRGVARLLASAYAAATAALGCLAWQSSPALPCSSCTSPPWRSASRLG